MKKHETNFECQMFDWDLKSHDSRYKDMRPFNGYLIVRNGEGGYKVVW